MKIGGYGLTGTLDLSKNKDGSPTGYNHQVTLQANVTFPQLPAPATADLAHLATWRNRGDDAPDTANTAIDFPARLQFTAKLDDGMELPLLNGPTNVVLKDVVSTPMQWRTPLDAPLHPHDYPEIQGGSGALRVERVGGGLSWPQFQLPNGKVLTVDLEQWPMYGSGRIERSLPGGDFTIKQENGRYVLEGLDSNPQGDVEYAKNCKMTSGEWEVTDAVPESIGGTTPFGTFHWDSATPKPLV